MPVAAGHRDGEGCAVPVDDHMMLGPGAAAVHGRGPTRSPFQGPDVRAIDRAVVHVQQVSAAHLGKQSPAQSRPDARFGPVAQPTPTGHPRAADHLSGDITPGHTLAQHVDDAGQRHPVGHPQPPGVAMPTRRQGGSNGAMRSHSSSGTRSVDTPESLPRRSPGTSRHTDLFVKRSVKERFVLAMVFGGASDARRSGAVGAWVCDAVVEAGVSFGRMFWSVRSCLISGRPV